MAYVDESIRKLQSSQIQKEHIELYNSVCSFIDMYYKENDLTFKEYLYLYSYDLYTKPICKCCDNKVRFNSCIKGYVDFCSNECSGKYKKSLSIEDKKNISDKRRATTLEKYGVDNVAKSKDIQSKIKETNIEKYGTYFPLFNEDIKQKKKETNLKNWGGHPLSNKKKIIERSLVRKKTMNDKWVVSINSKLVDYDILSIDENNREVCVRCKKCGNIQNSNHNTIVQRIGFLCYVCNPNNVSSYESEIRNYIKELQIDIIEGNRTILDGKELDIYIPSKNIAIEFNGLYWHSENFKDKNYHLNKSLDCLEKGIQLLHIWEDEWVFKQNIVKSIILNKLGLIKEKIYARQTEIRIVEDSKLVRKFLDENHIQGYSQSSIKLGLYYQNELVSLMTFGYRHTNSKKEFELIRFCNILNTNVIGASSKLFNYFKKNYEFTDLISYSDFRLFDGKMYSNLGFNKIHLSKPDYFWCKGLERKHRFNFNKQKLIKEGFDGSKTEVEIMHERSYFRIFGCGQYRWEIKKEL